MCVSLGVSVSDRKRDVVSWKADFTSGLSNIANIKGFVRQECS